MHMLMVGKSIVVKSISTCLEHICTVAIGALLLYDLVVAYKKFVLSDGYSEVIVGEHKLGNYRFNCQFPEFPFEQYSKRDGRTW